MKLMRFQVLLAFALSALFSVRAETLISLNSPWLYQKGTEEASSPSTAWRAVGFNDGSWLTGNTPVYYGENVGPGTLLSDMRNNYTTVYLRKTFNLAAPAEIDRLALRVHCDDGFIAWINGQEVARYNAPAGEPAYNGRAQGATEPSWITNSISSPSSFLVAGQNVIAVHLLNANPTSSDIVFNLQLDSTVDKAPPAITSVQPPPGAVEELREITIEFSEPVQGVDAADLLVNNTQASSVTGAGTQYTFTFDQPPFGTVSISWDEGHFIQDFADPPHDFDRDGPGAAWSYQLEDTTSPRVISINPPPGAKVRSLSQVEIGFSETVQGINASDLLINGAPAQFVHIRPGNAFVFELGEQPPGLASLSWAPDHNIRDHASPPNPLVAESWSYDVDPTLPATEVVISEFITAQENANGLKDEDGELQDWIELHNTTTSSVNLAGWSLTDDPDEPGLWVFPDVTIQAGGRLVVFASGKNRTGTQLHTNFKLGSDGEYLALFNAESPRQPLTEFEDDYPEQRNDYSYGIDPNGLWRYYATPTPGQPNGASSIVGIAPPPQPNFTRGFYETSFSLELLNPLPGSTIRFTLNGDLPTASTGQVYSGPIQVNTTRILRAAVFASNYLPSYVITHTYIFLDDVLQQPPNPVGFPPTWGTHSGFPNNLIPADYEMDPEIVNDPLYSSEMKAALQALPVLSIVMKTADMFGSENGIYTHTSSRGPAWERPCSVEFMPLDRNGFQVNAGVQIQGNAAREPLKNPKHPMRLVFKGDYGPKTLQYRMFPDSPVDVFDTLVLRADFNYSWLHWNPTQRIRAQRTRDSWVKDTMRAMGGLASHNRYVHLYINGLYWGIYDPSERPDGAFGAAYLGGEKEDYDVMNEGAVVDGSKTTYDQMLAISGLDDPAQYELMKTYLDMTQFIDYMLLHFFVGHEDWFFNKNWYALRPKDGSSGYKYVPWDGEMVLGNLNVNRVNATDLPSGLHPKLLASDEYKLDFADRVHKHLFNTGALTPAKNIERWLKRSQEVELPIIAESARWGDYRRDVHQYQTSPYYLYTRDGLWMEERQRLTTEYFPSRTSTLLTQLRNAGLYPSVAAPSFNQMGGHVAPGFRLIMNAPAGNIYYTTDGSDPRVDYTAGLSSSAQRYSAQITVNEDVIIKARVLQGSTWSALTEAVFTTQSIGIPLRITELMYDPEPPGDEFEFIEIQNVGSVPLDISSFYITGLDYVFPPQTLLAPGQIILLASGSGVDPTAFETRYPDVSIFGRFTGQLSNAGERIALVTPEGRTVVSVDYDDERGWPEEADGEGYSLEMLDPLADPDDPANWQHSVSFNGTPGQPNSAHEPPSVIINELQAIHPSENDWIELLNISDSPVDLTGWFLIDTGFAAPFIFPAGIVLNGGEYLIIHCDGDTNAPGLHTPFALDSQAETIVLRNPAGQRISIVTYGPQAPGYTFGRVDGQWVLNLPTPGSANEPAELGSPTSLLLNELLADPIPGEDDWLEIFNFDPSKPVSLRGLFLSTEAQLFEITSHSFVPPGGHVRLIADENPGPHHVDFRLPSAGSTLALLFQTGELIDELSYVNLPEARSFGRYPDGTDNLVLFDFPTPRAQNSLGFEVSLSGIEGGIQLSWPSVAGRIYRVESTPVLLPPAWDTVSEFAATNITSTLDAPANETTLFYRVVALPE